MQQEAQDVNQDTSPIIIDEAEGVKLEQPKGEALRDSFHHLASARMHTRAIHKHGPGIDPYTKRPYSMPHVPAPPAPPRPPLCVNCKYYHHEPKYTSTEPAHQCRRLEDKGTRSLVTGVHIPGPTLDCENERAEASGSFSRMIDKGCRPQGRHFEASTTQQRNPDGSCAVAAGVGIGSQPQETAP
jgi:hypothetical protein